jgi:hypothetical protein
MVKGSLDSWMMYWYILSSSTFSPLHAREARYVRSALMSVAFSGTAVVLTLTCPPHHTSTCQHMTARRITHARHGSQISPKDCARHGEWEHRQSSRHTVARQDHHPNRNKWIAGWMHDRYSIQWGVARPRLTFLREEQILSLDKAEHVTARMVHRINQAHAVTLMASYRWSQWGRSPWRSAPAP